MEMLTFTGGFMIGGVMAVMVMGAFLLRLHLIS